MTKPSASKSNIADHEEVDPKPTTPLTFWKQSIPKPTSKSWPQDIPTTSLCSSTEKSSTTERKAMKDSMTQPLSNSWKKLPMQSPLNDQLKISSTKIETNENDKVNFTSLYVWKKRSLLFASFIQIIFFCFLWLKFLQMGLVANLNNCSSKFMVTSQSETNNNILNKNTKSNIIIKRKRISTPNNKGN